MAGLHGQPALQGSIIDRARAEARMADGLDADAVAAYWKTVDAHILRYGKAFVPALITRAEGSYVYDETGRAILDFTSGQMCATLGHNHPAVKEAIRGALDEPMHLYSAMLSPAVLELAEALAGMLPDSLQKALFLSTGGESNEAAIRMAKLATGGHEMLSVGSAWHGMTSGAQASTFGTKARLGYGPMAPGTQALPPPNPYRCPIRHCRDACDMACLEVGFRMADEQSVGDRAGLICEPVLAAGGIVVPPEGYLPKLVEMAHARGMLVIFDEAQTGLGRVGSLFYFEQAGVVPDILTVSKTLGGGMALAATVTGAALEEKLAERGFYFYTSHVNDPLPARVGLAILRLLREEKLAERARAMGTYLLEGLSSLQQRHEHVGDVRGVGLITGIELVHDRESRRPWPELGAAVIGKAFAKGLHLTPSGAARGPEGGTVVKIAPPLTVTSAEIDSALAILDECLTEGVG